MNYQILSRRQMLSEHICLDSNSCASWWNKTSGLKFVLCFTVYSSCYFHFQNADNLSSRFSKLNHMNAGISPSCKFHLKYYFTDRTCSTSNIHSILTYKGLRTQLCYTNAIFCELHTFLICIHTEEKQMQKAS